MYIISIFIFVCIYVGNKLISWSSSVINWTKLSEAPKIQRHVGPHPFKGPWALPWALIHSVRMPYGRKASNASQASHRRARGSKRYT